jgi:hypothetical protein
MADEEEDQQFIVCNLSELIQAGVFPPPRVSASDIANAQGDDAILNVLKQILEDLFDSSLPSECDDLMERLSFTARPVLPERKMRAWSDFLEEKKVWMDYLETWAIARWYQDRGQLDHAAAVYEGLDVEAHKDDCGLGYDYLVDMMDVYGDLGEYDRVRDIFADVRRFSSTNEVDGDLFRRAKQTLAETVTRVSTEIAAIDLREVVVLLKDELSETVNDLENAKFEADRLRAGVNIREERVKAEEWLDPQSNNLRNKLCDEAWSALVDAVVFMETPALRDSFFWCIPVACQKAIEAEFNTKIWTLVRDLAREKTGDKKYLLDRSINQIVDILNPREMKKPMERAFIEGLRIDSLIKNAATILSTIPKLKVLEKDSTDARHGSLSGKAYSKQRLIKFAQEMELAKPDGWIFRWLGEASCIR